MDRSTATAFLSYVEQILVPTLAPGDVVVMDNLGSHKSDKMRAAIRKTGARLLFLRPYPPDRNPIEQVFAKLKTPLRKAEGRTTEAVWKTYRRTVRLLHAQRVCWLSAQQRLRFDLSRKDASSLFCCASYRENCSHCCRKRPRVFPTLIESGGIPKGGEQWFMLSAGRRPAGMARAYSLDLRERVVAMVDDGEAVRTVASAFDVSVSSVVKWAQRARATGSAAAKAMGGKRPFLLAQQRDWLVGRLEEKPDLTLHALLDELRRRGTVVSCDTLWRFLRREEITFKKNLVRRRAGPSGRGAPSSALEKVPGPD
jgi:transposase